MRTSYTVEMLADEPPDEYQIDHGINWQEALKGDTVPTAIINGVVKELKKQGINVMFISVIDVDRRSHSKAF